MTSSLPRIVTAADAGSNPARERKLVDDKSRRDYALLLNGLQPLLDLAGLLFATNLIAGLHAHPSAAQEVFEPRLLVVASLLACILLYDRRFVSVTVRGHVGALIRCYLTGFGLFAGGVILIGLGIVRVAPADLLALWLVLAFVLTASVRVALAAVVRVCVRRRWLTESVAIVGAGPPAERLVQQLLHIRPVTSEVLGVFDDNPPPALNAACDENAHAAKLTGTIDDLLALGKSRRIDWIFLTPRHANETDIAAIVHRLKALSVPVAICSPTLHAFGTCKRVDNIADTVPVTLLQFPLDESRDRIRSLCQFLPRWIGTLLTALGWMASAVWRRIGGRGKLVCELDNYDLQDFASIATSYGQHRFGYVVTPNVDHFIRLHDDGAFRDLYTAAEYVLMDSRFLANLLRIANGVRLPVCTGSDLTAALLATLTPTDRLVIVGGSESQIADLTLRFDLQNVVHHNPAMGFIHDEVAVAACLTFIESHAPFRDCLLAVGSPQQEILAQRLRARGAARGLALCVGASIDFLTGRERRAPRWMQRCGLEWSYRLAQNPARLAKRYLVRGPRIFWLLRKTKFVLRTASPPIEVTPARAA